MRALVAVDGSPNAEAVCKAVAGWLANPHDKAELCTILDESEIRATSASSQIPEITPQGGWSGSAIRVEEPAVRIAEDRSQAFDRAEANARDRLEELAETYLSGIDHEVHVIASTGTADAILEEAHDLDVDAIALGTHGRTGVRRAIFGSVAEAVVRHASIPVLLVRGSGD